MMKKYIMRLFPMLETPLDFRTLYFSKYCFTLLLTLFGLGVSSGQVANYIFTSSTGTYTPITGGTVVASGASIDTNTYSVTLPTSFVYNNSSITTVGFNIDGYLVMGNNNSASFVPLSSTLTANGIISALGMDLIGTATTTEMRWQQIGNEIIFQWKNFRRYAEVEQFSFQIRLNTATKTIQFVYDGSTNIGTTIDRQPQVGLRGSTNTDFNARRLTTSFPDTTPSWQDTGIATSNANTIRFTSTSIAAFPTAGLTFSWFLDVAPVASAVTFSGTLENGSNLAGSYTYSDAENDLEATSTFKWYSATNNTGTGSTEIAGATSSSLALTNDLVGKFIRFGVAPKAATGNPTGVETFSSWQGPILNIPTPTATSATTIETTSFTAHWEQQPNATGYELDVSTNQNFQISTSQSITEGFESGMPTSYSTLTATLATGAWNLKSIIRGSSPNMSSGLYSCQMQGATSSAITSPILDNISTINFKAKRGLNATSLQVYHIINSVETLKQTINLTTTFTNYTITINANESGKIKIVNSGSNVAYFDELQIDYTILTPSFLPGYNSKTISGGSTTSETISGLTQGTTYYYRVRAVKDAAISANSNTITVTTKTPNSWNGTTSTSWNDAANWSANAVPTSTDNIIISTNTPNAALLDVDFTLSSGKSLTLSGTGTLSIAPNKTLAIAGNADFGGKAVTLVSDATGTANIGEVSGSLIGASNVTVERFIPSKRAWRILAAPLKGTSNNTIANNWQGTANEGVLLFSPATYQGQAMTGYTTGGSAPNILKFNAGWQKIANLSSETMFGANATDNNAYLVFPTGPHGSSYVSSNSGSAVTTLRPKGELITGTVTHSLTADTYKVIANPYPSILDTEELVGANSGSKVWLLDPSLGALGAYVTYDGANWSVATAGADKNIQSGQGFIVKSSGTSFVISESNKTTGFSTNWLSRNNYTNATTTTNADKIRLTLHKQINNEWQLIDGALAVNAATENNAVDGSDASKISNFNESLMFLNGATNLAIEYRNLPEAATVQPIKMTGTTATAYQLRVVAENYTNSSLIPVLEDTLLNTSTEIPVDGSSITVPFTGVAATATNPDVRFRIAYRTTLSNPDFDKLGVSVYPNPVTDGFIQIRLANTTHEATFTLHNLLGQFVMEKTLTELDNKIEVSDLNTGFYILEIVQDGKKFNTKIYID